MDALAADGLILDQNYAYVYCSPSRSSLQAGRNPIHCNLDNSDMFLVNPADPVGGYAGIPRNMTTIGVKLGNAGYSTHFFGKWHVGIATPDHSPQGRGWQSHMIYFDGANDYWTSISGACGKEPITDLWVNNTPAVGWNNSWSCSQKDQSVGCTFEDQLFLDQVLASIENADPNKPFFEIWAPHTVHAPLEVPEAWAKKFNFIQDSDRALYAAKVAWVDDALSQVVAALKAKGLWDDMLFVMTADNGGPIYNDGSAGANNWPLRGGKTSNWQGGVRVNGFVNGGLLPQSRRGQVEESFVTIADWYPTFCALAGVDPFDERAAAAGLPPVDGVNLWPLISGANSTAPRTEVPLGMPTISSGNAIGGSIGVQGIIGAEGYKLLIGDVYQNVWTSPRYPNASSNWKNIPEKCGDPLDGTGKGCLFNIFDDPTEHNNLAESMPDKVTELRARITFYNSTIYLPDRGTSSPLACEYALNTYHGFWGPFIF